MCTENFAYCRYADGLCRSQLGVANLDSGVVVNALTGVIVCHGDFAARRPIWQEWLQRAAGCLGNSTEAGKITENGDFEQLEPAFNVNVDGTSTKNGDDQENDA